MKEGKTYREICHIAHIAPRDIKSISKEYEQQKRLENNKRKGNTQESTTKKPSISSQAFILFKEGKQIDEVKVLLDIPYKLAIGYWRAYLEAIRMFESFEFYQENSYDMPTFLRLNTFLKLNNVYGTDIVNVLRTAKDILNLNKTYSNLKIEINNLEQKRMKLLYYSHPGYSLQPLSLNKPNYNYYRY